MKWPDDKISLSEPKRYRYLHRSSDVSANIAMKNRRRSIRSIDEIGTMMAAVVLPDKNTQPPIICCQTKTPNPDNLPATQSRQRAAAELLLRHDFIKVCSQSSPRHPRPWRDLPTLQRCDNDATTMQQRCDNDATTMQQ